MNSGKSNRAFRVLLAITFFALTTTAFCGDGPGGYPRGPVNFIVPWGAGGGSDLGSRILAGVAEKYLGAPLVVQNRPGAGGAIGWTSLYAARPNGQTVALTNVPAMQLVALTSNVRFDTEKFTSILCLVDDPAFLLVRKDNGKFTTIEEFFQYAKDHPGEVTVGTSGAGTDGHFAIEIVNKLAGVKLNPLPFNGVNQSVTSMLGGHCDASLPKTSEALSALESGEGLVLAVFHPERLPEYPDVPTLKEIGYDFSYSSSRGIIAPPGVPQDVADYLHDKLKLATEDPEYIEKMENAGLPIHYMSGPDYKKYYMEQYEMFKPEVVNFQNIQ